MSIVRPDSGSRKHAAAVIGSVGLTSAAVIAGSRLGRAGVSGLSMQKEWSRPPMDVFMLPSAPTKIETTKTRMNMCGTHDRRRQGQRRVHTESLHLEFGGARADCHARNATAIRVPRPKLKFSSFHWSQLACRHTLVVRVSGRVERAVQCELLVHYRITTVPIEVPVRMIREADDGRLVGRCSVLHA